MPVDEIIALARSIEAADKVHQRRLTGARRSHDRDVFTLLDFDIHARYSVDLLIAHQVGLPEIIGPDDDILALQLRAALLRRCYCYVCHAVIYDSVFTGALLSILIFASFRSVRMTL